MTKQKDPAFLLYSGDFLSGVSDFTMEERGYYITLLCLQHQKGVLTDKIIEINAKGASKDVLKKFPKVNPGEYANKKLEKVVKERKAYTKNQTWRSKLGNFIKKMNASGQEKYVNTFKKEAKECLTDYSSWEDEHFDQYLNNILNKVLRDLPKETHVEDEDEIEDLNNNIGWSDEEKTFINKLADEHRDYWFVKEAENPRLYMDVWRWIHEMKKDQILFLSKQLSFYKKIVATGRFKCTLPNWMDSKWNETNYSDEYGQGVNKMGPKEITKNASRYVS